MKSLFVCILGLLVATGADAATSRGRKSMAGQMMDESRAVASKNQISAMAMGNASAQNVSVNPGAVEAKNTDVEAALAVTPEVMKPAPKDNRDKEKRACLANNVGVGNTFVWASRYSNLNDYSMMVEDIEEPDNNTCFVRVELKSNDSKISVADIPGKYYEMGRDISCGEWADAEILKKRILDAKKSARTWATVGGAVGGAGIGVGAMEAFGNKLIGGKVMGQKELSGAALLRSQLAVLEKENPTEHKRFVNHLKTLKTYCVQENIGDDMPTEMDCQAYEELFDLAI